MTFKKGDKVRFSKAGKQAFAVSSRGHLGEFGDCHGIVIGLTDYHNPGEEFDPDKIGPEYDVRWMPSNLRYAYDPCHIELVPS